MRPLDYTLDSQDYTSDCMATAIEELVALADHIVDLVVPEDCIEDLVALVDHIVDLVALSMVDKIMVLAFRSTILLH